MTSPASSVESSPRPGGVVVVTGAASGIGAGVARWLTAVGVQVVAIDLTEPPAGNLGASAWVTGDVADETTSRRAAQAADDLGPLVGWVNSAGIAPAVPVHDLSLQDLGRVLEVNIGGTAMGCRTVVEHWRHRDEPRGAAPAIVNISSTQAMLGFAGYPAYAASKGGIESLTRQVAAEYAADGIRCNAVAPGVIATALNDRLLAEAEEPEQLRAAWDALCPLGRWGSVDDVAAAVSWLLSPQASFVTGQVLRVDGGQSVVPPGHRAPTGTSAPTRTGEVRA